MADVALLYLLSSSNKILVLYHNHFIFLNTPCCFEPLAFLLLPGMLEKTSYKPYLSIITQSDNCPRLLCLIADFTLHYPSQSLQAIKKQL